MGLPKFFTKFLHFPFFWGLLRLADIKFSNIVYWGKEEGREGPTQWESSWLKKHNFKGERGKNFQFSKIDMGNYS